MADEYEVRREIDIAAPPDEVYGRIVDFHRWPAWSPWEDVDPDMERSYAGPDAGVGATYSWSGNRKAGAGTMTIVDVAEDERVSIDLRFEKPFRSTSITTFALAPLDGGTHVTWTLRGPKTLMTRVMGLFTSMDRMVGPDFERGLARLRDDAEA